MALGTGAAIAAAPSAASAHEVGLSRGVYVATGAEVTAEITFARDELRGLAPGLDTDGDAKLSADELSSGTGALQVIADGFHIVGDTGDCEPTIVDAALTEEDGARVRLRYTCPAPPSRLDLSLPIFDALAFGHRHLGAVNRSDGEPLADLVLHRRSREATVELGAPSAPPRPPVGEYFKIGIEHILIGTDHLVFLLGLVVVGGRLHSLIAVITAFTIGHSLSLALATLGIWTPDPGFVEPAIALSIAYVGVENFFVPDAAGRWRITLPFGFIHGFGFAGVLAEVGLPGDAVGLALLLFNLGVEAGQLLVLAVVLPLLAWLGGRAFYRDNKRGARWISAAIVVAGVYWFVTRVMGE